MGNMLFMSGHSILFLRKLYFAKISIQIWIPVRPPADLNNTTISLIARESQVKFGLANSNTARLLRKSVHVEIIDIDSSYGPRRSYNSSLTSFDSESPPTGVVTEI